MASPDKSIGLNKIKEDHADEPESNKYETTDSIDPEVLDSLPPEFKKAVEMSISMQRFSGSLPNPLLSKITEKHIDKILDLSEKEDVNAFKDAQISRRYGAFYFLVILSLFVFLVVFLIDKDTDLLKMIIEKVIFVIAGFAGGYGYKAWIDYKNNK